jgi:hypothetical protein
VTVQSLYEGLQGPGTNIISSITSDGDDITPNSGTYGFTLPEAPTVLHGTINPNVNCTTLSAYCGSQTTPKTVFDTNNEPIDTARVRMDLAAGATYTDVPGTYEDTLTFIAIATY